MVITLSRCESKVYHGLREIATEIDRRLLSKINVNKHILIVNILMH